MVRPLLRVLWYVRLSTLTGPTDFQPAGLREYLVSPLLVATRATRQHSARGNEYLVGTASPTTVSDMRTSRLLDSAIVGALGGPAMSPTFRRALRSRRPLVALQHLAGASLTAALISSFLQIAVNQSRVLRISYLARRESRPVPIQRSEEKSTSEQVRDAFQNPVRDPGGEKLGEKSLPGRIMRTLSTFLPIQNLSDEEYLEALERKKGEVEKRLLEIEREEGRIYEYASRGGREA